MNLGVDQNQCHISILSWVFVTKEIDCHKVYFGKLDAVIKEGTRRHETVSKSVGILLFLYFCCYVKQTYVTFCYFLKGLHIGKGEGGGRHR